jgi:hypothetical protein
MFASNHQLQQCIAELAEEARAHIGLAYGMRWPYVEVSISLLPAGVVDGQAGMLRSLENGMAGQLTARGRPFVRHLAQQLPAVSAG